MNIYIETFKETNANHYIAAAEASAWSQQAQMCDLQPQQFALLPRSILATSDQNVLLGHIAVTQHNADLTVIGGLIVNPEFRQQAIGTMLANCAVNAAATELSPSKEYVAYTTYEAAKTFKKVGGKLIGFREPSMPGRGNWIISLTDAVRQTRKKPSGHWMVY